MHVIHGLQLGIAAAGIKYPNRNDLVIMKMSANAVVAGVFTKNAFCAEPVKVAKKHLAIGQLQALVINSGNANACTGEQGYEAAIATCSAVSKHLGCNITAVLPFSTGVIGQVLPVDKVVAAVPRAVDKLSENGWAEAAQAIMTTDTHPKGASVEVIVQGERVRVTGIAKGAGMIKPNMATMLAFIATDANIEQPVLNRISQIAANRSFNRISIDGDTSTNDACILVATGESAAPNLGCTEGELFETLLAAISEVYQQLAQLIVRDGEGATKFIEVEVSGGKSNQECLDVAYTIAHSPLVKTAFFASDPNWGRIVAAIGNAGIDRLDTNKVTVMLDDLTIVENGCIAAAYTELAGQAVMQKDEIKISVRLGRGKQKETIWTTDLSHDYIKINAEYRT